MPTLRDLLGGGFPTVPAAAPASGLTLRDLVAEPLQAPREYQVGYEDPYSKGPPVEDSEDLQRILRLPRRAPPDLVSPRAEALVEMMTARFARQPGRCACRSIDPRRECITRLLPVQAWMLYEMGIVDGLLGAVAVGAGKTIVGILSVLALPRASQALMLVPPSLLEQLVLDYQLLAQHFHVPRMVTLSGPAAPVCGDPSRVVHVLPYSQLCRPDSSARLEQLQPDAIIADECDRLRATDSATTARVLRYFAAHSNTRFCGWTGSLTDAKITDFSHLAALALRYGSPLPLNPEVAEEWDRVLGAGPVHAPAGALMQLCAPGEKLQEAWSRRIIETLGMVVTTGANEVITKDGTKAVELEVRERHAPPLPAEIQEALKSARNYVRPDGEELVDALSMIKCATEVALGFYYRWKFVRGELQEAILEWLAARKLYNRELREKLRDRFEYLDSPNLCQLAAERYYGQRAKRNDRPEWASQHWPRWLAIKDLVKPITEAVPISDYLINDAAQWGREHRGIIWYSDKWFGHRLAEVSGFPLHTGGPKAGLRLRMETGRTSIICSLDSHGRGRDGLQHLFSEQLIVGVPSSATRHEQLYGRLVRRGQSAGEVVTDGYFHTPELRKSMRMALQRTRYVQGTLRQTQRLMGAWEGFSNGEEDEEEIF
jgi:hypothetical protein